MAEDKEATLFRKQTIDRISSPEQLTDYLKVTNPGIWIVLLAVIVLLTGLLVWSASGRLETRVPASMTVQAGEAEIIAAGQGAVELKEGMTVQAGGDEYIIRSVRKEPSGRTVAHTEAALPDGTYEVSVITESIRPIDFLFRSR